MLNLNLMLNIFIYIFVTFFIAFLFFNEKIISFSIEELKGFILEFFSYRLKSSIFIKILWLFLNLLEAMFVAVILVLFIQKFYIGNFLVPTKSMMPLILPGDRIFANMCIYKFKKPEINDVLIFEEPINNSIFFAKRLIGLPGDKIKIANNKLYINENIYEDRLYSSEFSDFLVVPKKGDVVDIYIDNYADINFLDEDMEEIKKNIIDGILSDKYKINFLLEGKKTEKIMDLLHYDKIVLPLLKGKKVKVKLKKNYYFVLGDNTQESFDSRMWGFLSEDLIKGKVFFKFWPINSMERI